MEFLGIGPSELLFILIIALILLGPRDMQKAGRALGKWMQRIVKSDGWRVFQQTSHEIQTLPNRLMRDAALDEFNEMQKDIRRPLEELQKDLRQPFEIQPGEPPSASEGVIDATLPPAAVSPGDKEENV